MDILEKFLKYVSFDTTSDALGNDTPSTDGQLKFAEFLVKELAVFNLDEIHFDKKYCYVYGLLKGNPDMPKIGFVSHLDTYPKVTGKDIKPKIISNYDGSDIVLKDNVILSSDEYLDLQNHIGKTLITSSGETLLGADDKAGIVEIMAMLEHFSVNKEEHGDIFVCFTPDEEIGLGTLHLDKRYFRPDFAYTVDGTSLGEFSYENFNAASAMINIKGNSIHCGSAKGKMINAGRIATLINFLIPDEIPENTDNYEGFFHLENINGDVSSVTMKYLIRDFDKDNFEKRKQLLLEIVKELNKKYNNCIEIEIEDKYYNMLEVISDKSDLIENTLLAISSVGITPKVVPIRGGTDGTQISYMGIPCPNLGTGGHNLYSVYEYVLLEDMICVRDILIAIVRQFSDECKIKSK